MDTSKSVFQLHGVDAWEQPVLIKKLKRREMAAFFERLAPVKIGIEACGASHHWARELGRLGHEVVLVPPQHVKPYVGRNKHDAADAAAICEAMSRPRVQELFVAPKTVVQQAARMLLTTRDQLVRRRTQLANKMRGDAAEFGHTAAKGLWRIEPLVARVLADDAVPVLAKELFALLLDDYRGLEERLKIMNAKLAAFYRKDETAQRLADIPTIGPVGATLLSVKVSDAKAFKSGRDFAAWLGLTPRNHSTAGKTRLGVITRAGDETLRSVLVVGASAVIQQVRRGRSRPSPWLARLLERKPAKLAAVALANKTARIAWKLMVSGQDYDPERLSLAPCLAPSRPLRAASGGDPKGSALTAPARAAQA